LGYGLKYLFGTADAQDVKRLTAVCNKLHAFESKMTHAVEHQLTYIQTLDEVTRQNAIDIANLTETLRDSIRNFSLQQNRVKADLQDTQAALEKQARFSAAIREIEMAILELKFSVLQLLEALHVTSMGQLSSVLINPYNLSVILQQVSLQLPAGLSM
jgi:septal ring factor EnvC (AmiA/AmiB activator)